MNLEPLFTPTAFLNSLGPAVGLLLMARYLYNFFFGDEDVSDRVVTQARVGFIVFLAGYATGPVYSGLSLARSLVEYFPP